jgi:parallel beta-helix repeat protein
VLEGILSVYCDFVDIIGNTVTDTQGVSPQDGIEPANTTNFQIIANTIQNCGQQGIDIFDLCVDGVVSHNIINDCELDCITFGGDSLGNQRVVITSNICQGSVNGNGIGTLINSIPSEQVIIVGNTIQNVNDGIFVNQNSFGVVVANNTIDTAASTGIDIRSIDTIVANNVIRDFGTGLGSGRYGILLQFASGCEIIGNTVRDTQATKTSQHGIYMLNGSVGNAILSNTVSDCGEHGIYIQSDTNRVEANSIIDIGHNVANRSGIFIQASNCTVKDNYCANPGAVANYSFGIQNSSGDNNIIQSNTITNGLVLEGIRIASGTGAVVNGNQMAAFNLNDQGINTLITNNNMAAIVGTSGGGRQAQINFISGVWTP